MFTTYDALDAFFEEHRRCGELDGGVEDGRVWMACECGAVLYRPLPRKSPRDSRPASETTTAQSGQTWAGGARQFQS